MAGATDWEFHNVHFQAVFERPLELFEISVTTWDCLRGDRMPIPVPQMMRDRGLRQRLAGSFIQSSWSVATRRQYAGWVRVWMGFARDEGVPAMPADVEVLLTFVMLLTSTYAMSTVTSALSAVLAWHALNDVQSPGQSSPRVLRVWRAVMRFKGVTIQGPKLVVGADFIAGAVQWWLSFPLADRRAVLWISRALAAVLVGWEAGLRVSELLSLTLCNWRPQVSGSILLRLLQTKNNKRQGIQGSNVYLTHAGPTCFDGSSAVGFPTTISAAGFVQDFYLPVLAQLGVRRGACRTTDLSMARCTSCPFLFPTVSAQGRLTGNAMSAATLSTNIKTIAGWLGLPTAGYSGVSLRRGAVTEAARELLDRDTRQRYFRWANEQTQDVYIRLQEETGVVVQQALHGAVQRAAVSLRASPVVRFDFGQGHGPQASGQTIVSSVVRRRRRRVPCTSDEPSGAVGVRRHVYRSARLNEVAATRDFRQEAGNRRPASS